MKKKKITQYYTSEKLCEGYKNQFAFVLDAIAYAQHEIRAGRDVSLYDVLEAVSKRKEKEKASDE